MIIYDDDDICSPDTSNLRRVPCLTPTHVITFNYVIFFFKLPQVLTCVRCLCQCFIV